MAQDWIHLAGNHERQILNLTANSSESDTYAFSQLSAKELNWLASLTYVGRLNKDVLLCHGTPSSDSITLLETANRAATRAEIALRLAGVSAAVVLCGHTHVARSVRFGNTLIVNPGSVGHPAFADDFPYPHVIESGSPDARYAILEKRTEGWVAMLVMVPYDNRHMVELARLRQYPDWESALTTGYMS